MIGANVTALNRVQREMISGWEAIVQPILDQCRGILMRNADRDGLIPPSVAGLVKAQLGNLILSLFGQRGQAFSADNRPLAPFPALVNKGIVRSTLAAALPHTRYLEQHLPDDVQRLMTGRVREQVESLFSPNPFVQYEPAHTWVDPNGYTLSPRIWRAGRRTRLQMDTLLDEMIRRGMGAADMADNLEWALLPTRANIRTRTPYQRDLSFDAMRLARTENTRAHTQAGYTAALNNPFTDFGKWNLSARHPRIDICDDFAHGGTGGDGTYPLHRMPLPVKDSHPHCICYVTFGSSRSIEAVVGDLRQRLLAARAVGQRPQVTPLALHEFLTGMLGGYLSGLAQRWFEMEVMA